MIETIFICSLLYAFLGVIFTTVLVMEESDFTDCGMLVCLLLWPVILLGVLITGLMKICKVIAREWNEG